MATNKPASKKVSQPKRFAVFDIDGTLIRWQLYHAIADALRRQNVIDPKVFEQVRIARMKWKFRGSENAYHEYEQTLIKVFDAAMVALPVSIFQLAANSVFDEYKDQAHTFTRDLIAKLKRDGYTLFAISGSPSVIVEKLAEHYGFDDFAACEYTTRNGYFTGEKDSPVGHKEEALERLMEEHHVSFKDSIAVADTESDISLLALVENPIAFNPNRALLAHAQKAGWRVIVERKNVIYDMRPGDGSYILAATNA